MLLFINNECQTLYQYCENIEMIHKYKLMWSGASKWSECSLFKSEAKQSKAHNK